MYKYYINNKLNSTYLMDLKNNTNNSNISGNNENVRYMIVTPIILGIIALFVLISIIIILWIRCIKDKKSNVSPVININTDINTDINRVPNPLYQKNDLITAPYSQYHSNNNTSTNNTNNSLSISETQI